MPCYHPLTAWATAKTLSGKRKILFQAPRRGLSRLSEIQLPCGQCIGCRLERSRQWAIRCVHEAQMHEENCFLTLTYNEESLPKDGSVNVREFQLFMKRLRKFIQPRKVRFFHCGEYGDKLQRPHYHACLFGFDFLDKQLWKIRNGFRLYRSESLEKLWTKGHSLIGDVTFESAAYVARYIVKKINGQLEPIWYDGKQPEYVTMSRRPGIGKTWFDKYKSDVFPSDEVVLRGRPMRPPKFYDALFDFENQEEFSKIKLARVVDTETGEILPAVPFERLRDAEIIKKQSVKQLKRNLEVE